MKKLERMFKRFLSLALVVFMVVSMLPVNVFAAEGTETNIELGGDLDLSGGSSEDGNGSDGSDSTASSVFTVGAAMTTDAGTLEEAIAVSEYFYETIGNVAILGAPVITLNTDYEFAAPVVINSEYPVIIDLNGHTMTYNSTVMGESMITNKSELTIKDSSDPDSGVINYNYTGDADSTYGKGNFTITNAGKLTVDGGKITIANLSGHAKYPIDNNSTTGDAELIINGGHLYNYNTSAIRQFCNSTTYQNSVTINGGLIEGYCAIWVQNPGSQTVNGSLTIAGGEIKSTAKAYVNGTAELKDVASRIYFTIDGEGGAWSDTSAVTITGGTFNENVNLASEAPVATVSEGATFNGNLKLPASETPVAQIGETYYTSLQEALNAAAAGTGNVTVEILADVDLTGTTWNPVTVSAPGYPVVTVNGNDKTITGLNDMLFAGTWAGGSGLIINDLTIKNSNIVNDKDDSKGTVGVGAFIGYPQASATITLSNCHLVNSTVEGGHWTGGLIGMAGGYNGEDGPVFMNLTITGCSVTGSTITGKGSAGGVIGHGSCAAWTNVVIENTTVSGNTITSTGSSTVKAGSVMGTIGAAGQETTANGVAKQGGAFVSATVSGNTVTSGGTTITTIYGRQGSTTGTLKLTGGTYDSYPIEEGVAYAYPTEGHKIVENTDGTYGVKADPTYGKVAQIGDTYYASLAAAVEAAQDGDTITVIADHEMTWNNSFVDTSYAVMVAVVQKAVTIDLNGAQITVDTYKVNKDKLFAVFATDDGGQLTLVDSKGGAKVSATGECYDSSLSTAYCMLMAYTDGTKLTVKGGSYYMETAHDSLVYGGGHNVVFVEGGNFELGNVGNGENGKPWIFNVLGANVRYLTVTGGTFNSDVANQFWANEVYIPKEKAVVDNGNGTWTLVDAAAYLNMIGSSTNSYTREVGFASLQAAIDAAEAANYESIEIGLLADATLDVTAWQTLAIGGTDTKTITIEGNNHKLTFNQKNSDWNNVATNNDAKLILNNMTITNSGYNNGPWNRHDINFACDVALTNVTSDKALAFKADATLEKVTISDANTSDTYAIWIQPNGQTVTINNSTIDMLACTDGRGIKIDNQYVSEEGKVTMSVADTTFKTEEKGAILVKTTVGADITLSNVDISGVAADTVNAVWVDEDAAAYNELVIVTGGTKYQEGAVAKIGNKVYLSLDAAFAAAQPGDTVTLVADVTASETIKIAENVTLDLAGKTITGTDNATNSFALIEVQPGIELTVNDTVGGGKITLTATNNRGWNAYSSVISNQRGKLTVKGGTLEHLGGTDMAYGIDNLTNGKGTYAETIINGGTVKSTYRAIRQFLNGTEAQNILTVSGGTIEGTNKSIWMQDPSKNANSGTLTVGENAKLVGDVYLFVTAGSTEWPVTVSINADALAAGSKVLTSNVPYGYVVEETNGIWGVRKANYVAKIGEVGYESLDEAIAAAKAGDVVDLLGNSFVDADNFSLNGFTLANGSVTFKKGTRIGVSGNAVLDNVDLTFDMDGTSGYPNTAIYINGSSATSLTLCNGADVLIKNPGYTAIYNDGSAAYALNIDNSTLTIEGKGSQTGINIAKVTLTNGAKLNTSNTGIAINGGSVNVDGTSAVTVNGTSSHGITNVVLTVAAGGKVDVDNCAYLGLNIQSGSAIADGAVVTVDNCGTDGSYVGIPARIQNGVTGYDQILVNGEKIVAKTANGNAFTSIADAIKAATAGDTVTILAGDYTTDIAVNKAITVVGETDENGNNLVNITGKLNITADGATVKNMNVNNGSGNGGYINAKDVLVEGCTVVGGNGFRYCYTTGKVTFKDSTITGDVYGIHFDGSAGGEIVIDNCDITGWTSFASSINKVTMTNTEFKVGNYNYVRFYQNEVVIDGCTFNENMAVDLAVNGATVTVTNSTVENGTVEGLFEGADIVNSTITVDGVLLTRAAKIGNTYYKTIAEAIAAAQPGDTVTILAGTYAVPAMKAGITIEGEGEVLLEGTITGTLENLTLKNLHIKGGNTQRWAYAKGDLVFENVTFEATSVYAVHFDGITTGANLLYKDCTIIGWVAMSGSPASCVFDGCTIEDNGTYGVIRTYFDAEIKNCTFDVDGANTTDVYQDGIHAVDAKIEVNNSTNANGDIKDILNISYDSEIWVDGELVLYRVAKIGDSYYSTLAEAFAAAKNGDEVEILRPGTYALTTSGKDITITGKVDGVVFDNIGAKNMGGANVTFNNVTFDYYPNVNYTGLQHSGNLVYNNCTIDGQVFLYGQSETFNNCTFNQNSADAYNVWTYGANKVAFNECTFNSVGKSVLIYSESASQFNDVTVTDCDFIASAPVDGKAAIEMDSSLTSGIKLTIDAATTVTGFGTGNVSGNNLWNNKKDNKTDANNDITVVVNGETVLAPVGFVAQVGTNKYGSLAAAIAAAKAGDTVTLIADVTENVTVNKNLTIDGGNFKYTGTMTGNAGLTITVQNVNFVGGGFDKSTKSTTGTYTIKNCTFTDDGDYAYAFRFKGAKKVVIEDCTVEGYLYSFLYITSGTNTVTVKNVTVENCPNYAVYFASGVNSATFENLTVKNSNNGFIINNTANRSFTIKNCKMENVTTAINHSSGTKTITCKVEGDKNDFGTSAISQYAKISLAAADATLKASEGMSVVSGVDGYLVKYADGVYSLLNAVVYTKAELNAALAAAKDGDTITLGADIDYGTDHLEIAKAITLNLGGKTLTTRARNYGLALKNDACVVTNGKLNHAGTVAAIKVWNAAEISELEIDVTGTSASGNAIGGIVIQQNSAGVDVIKNVTIHSTAGQGLACGIETYNCGNATSPVIGSMENVTIDAKDTGMLISAPCGTATNCSIKGGNNGIEIWIKGTYSASLDLVNSTVEGGVFAHDEFSSNPTIVNNGTLKLTADDATTGATVEDITLTLARAEKVEGVLANVIEQSQAKLNDTYYLLLADAMEAAEDGDTVTILAGDYTTDIAVNKAITVVGETDENGNNLVNITGRVSASTGATVMNLNVHNEKTGDYDCALGVNGKDIVIDGVKLTGYNGMRYCYASGDITIKNSTINGSHFAVHFDGSNGGNIAFENCDITGWCSYAGTIGTVSYTNCSIDQGGYAGHRYYNKNVSFTECDFAEGIQLDLTSSTTKVAITDSDMTEAEAKAMFANDGNYVAMGNVTLNGVQLTYVASAYTASGSKYFDSLQAAIDEVINGGYITVRSDIVLTAPITVPAGKRVEIGLGDFNITYTSDVAGEAMINNNGELTVSGNGKIVYTYTGAADSAYTKGNYTINNSGKLTIDGVTVENATASMKHAYYAVNNGNGGEIVLEDGLILNTTNYAVRLFGNGSLTVNDGEIKGTRAVWMQAPGSNTADAPEIALTVNGGKLTATGETGYKLAVYSYTYGNSLENVSVTVTGGELDGDIALSGGANKTVAETVTITGGTISDLYSYAADDVAGKTVNVSGGTFKNPVAEAYCAEGYIPTANTDGTYGVKAGAYVAQIGETKYETLAEAIAAVKNGETITLLADCAENVTVIQQPDVAFTIDGNDKTMTGTITVNGKSAAYATAGLTIENINFVTTGDTTCINLGVSGDNNTRYTSNVTITGCTFTGTGNTAAAIKNYTGGCKNLTITDCTATGVHSLLQVKGVNGLKIADVTVRGENGISVGTSTNVVIEDANITATGYGIRADGEGAYKMTVKNATITAEMPIVVRKTTGAYELTVEGGTLTASNTDGYQVIFTAGDDGTYVEPTVEFKATIDESIKLFPVPVKNVAQIGDTKYESLSEALLAAKPGETVKLIADANEGDSVVVIMKNNIVDLNGFDLTAGGLVAFNGNYVIDSSAGTTGLLIVPQSNLTLPKNNTELPFWNESNGYYFVTPNTTAGMRQYQYITDVTADGFKFVFRPSFGSINGLSNRDTRLTYSANGLANNGLDMIVRLTWAGANGEPVTQEFKFSETLISGSYSSDNYMSLTMAGMPTDDVDVQVILASTTGVEFCGQISNYLAP